jgi:hypothetical protein
MAVRMACLTPARVISVNDCKGSLAAGKDPISSSSRKTLVYGGL